ncbi:MAG: SpoIID/LytB domain-containing protein [bacterium]
MLPINVLALSASEIEQQIIQKQIELDQLNLELKKVEAELTNNNHQKDSSTNEIKKIEFEIIDLETQAKLNTIQQQQMQNELEIQNLKMSEKEAEQNLQIATAYLDWKMNPNFTTKIIVSSKDTGFIKSAMYYNLINQDTNGGILSLANDISSLQQQNLDFSTNLLNIQEQKKTLEARKIFLDLQIANINDALKRSTQNSDGVRSKLNDVSQQIDQLSKEQQAIKDQEQTQTGGNEDPTPNITPQPPGTTPITGSFYFSGTGRDIYQGHGVGLSQFGAYGAAQKGWNAAKILTFYYSQTKIETRTGNTVTPQGYWTMGADEYVAGLGEIPSRACGTMEQIDAWNNFGNTQGWAPDDARRNKYVIDNASTVWDCWPEEAIKAQIIAARSYAVTNNQPICTSASCQVYVGGNAKAWVAWETADQYVVSTGSSSNNQIIRAFYSSDNNQGYGTADNDTVWSGFDGNGSAYSYLRSVNDNSVAYAFIYTHWAWNTYSYNNSDFDRFLTYASDRYTTGGANSFLKNLKNSVGTVQSISFERDASNRIKKVRITGTNGTGVIAGWLFKAVWNDWVYNTKSDGQRDYLYSLTFWQKQ